MKISIIGCGMVGSSIAYASIIKGLSDELVLVDMNKDLAKGHAEDLSDGIPYIKQVKISGGDYNLTSNSDIIIITAGKAQKTDQSRLDLVLDNSKIMKSIVYECLKYSINPIIIVVSNPVDILTYIAWKSSGLDRSRVFGTGTTLDTARLRYHLAEEFNINAKSIHAYVIGEHGDSEIVNWSTANIAGIPLYDICGDCPFSHKRNLYFNKIYEKTRNKAYKIIKRKGSTYYGIGLSTSRLLEAIITNENSVLTVSSIHDKYFDMKDIPFSLPTIINKSGIKKVLNINLDKKEQNSLKNSLRIIESSINSLNDY